MTAHSPAAQLEHMRTAVHAEIGKLLLIYQHLELMLKALLPHIHATEQAALAHADKDIDNLLDSKETMGLLVERLKNRLNISDPEAFATYLQRITENRNWLVHKFTVIDFGGLDNEAKCSSALEYLKAHHDFAQPLRGLLLSYLTALLS